MFGARVTKQAFAKISTRNVSTIPGFLYKNVWRKSNVMYIAYIATGCVVLGSIYGSLMNTVWESANRGKLYHQIDWSKFKSEDDE